MPAPRRIKLTRAAPAARKLTGVIAGLIRARYAASRARIDDPPPGIDKAEHIRRMDQRAAIARQQAVRIWKQTPAEHRAVARQATGLPAPTPVPAVAPSPVIPPRREPSRPAGERRPAPPARSAPPPPPRSAAAIGTINFHRDAYRRLRDEAAALRAAGKHDEAEALMTEAAYHQSRFLELARTDPALAGEPEAALRRRLRGETPTPRAPEPPAPAPQRQGPPPARARIGRPDEATYDPVRGGYYTGD